MQLQQRTQYLSQRRLSKRWNVPISTIQSLTIMDKLAPVKIGNKFYYTLESVKAYEDNHTVYPAKVTTKNYRKTTITLCEIAKMSIEKIASLSTEELIELSRKANNNLAEARSQKEWIDGIIAIKKLIEDRE